MRSEISVIDSLQFLRNSTVFGGLIVRYEGENSFKVYSRDFSVSINAPGGAFFLTLRDNEDADYCPRGVKCKNPTEGWIDLFKLSVALFPRGIVLVDEKASVGIGQIPPSIHVDMVISDENDSTSNCFQHLDLLETGEHVDPARCIVYNASCVHEMKLEPQWFQLISKGEKTVEVRLLDEKRRRLRVGHVLKFVNTENGKEIYARVSSIRLYNSIKELLNIEDISKVTPGLGYEDSLNVYRKYYNVDEKMAVAIALEVF